MDTVAIMFSTHPHRNQIEIIVEPLLRESLDMGNDIPSLSVADFEKYKAGLAEQGVTLNLSRVMNSSEPNAHVVDSFLNERGKTDRLEFLKIVKEEKLEGTDITKRYVEFLKEKMSQIPDYRYETHEEVETRAKAVHKMLSEAAGEMQEGDKIIAVTHSLIINDILKEKDGSHVKSFHGEILAMPLL